MRPQRITTDVEYVFDDSVTMISKGDLQGTITCVIAFMSDISTASQQQSLALVRSMTQ